MASSPDVSAQKWPGQARKEEKQRDRERYGDEQRAARKRDGLACPQARGGWAAVSVSGGVGHDGERGATEQRLQPVERHPHERLAVQTRRQEKKQCATDDNVLIALAARLEQLDRRHQHEHRRAGQEAIQGVELRKHRRYERQPQRDAHDAPWQAHGAEERREPPANEAESGDRDPRGDLDRVEQQGRRTCRAHPQQRWPRSVRNGAGGAHRIPAAATLESGEPWSASAVRHRWR